MLIAILSTPSFDIVLCLFSSAHNTFFVYLTAQLAFKEAAVWGLNALLF